MQVESEDAEIVNRIAAGDDRNAEEELCRRLRPRIHLYGLRHLRDHHAAEDLAQQVLLITLEALRASRLREPEKLVSFVLGTCRMTVLNLKRGRSRKERLLLHYGSDLVADTQPTQPLLEKERLERCVQSLAERERTVVVLTFYDEESASDVASALGLTQGNLRVIRHRAIHKLRECMGLTDPARTTGSAV